MGKVLRFDESQLEDHLGAMVRRSVEQTLNGLLDAEADQLCRAKRYERSPDRVDTLVAGNSDTTDGVEVGPLTVWSDYNVIGRGVPGAPHSIIGTPNDPVAAHLVVDDSGPVVAVRPAAASPATPRADAARAPLAGTGRLDGRPAGADRHGIGVRRQPQDKAEGRRPARERPGLRLSAFNVRRDQAPAVQWGPKAL